MIDRIRKKVPAIKNSPLITAAGAGSILRCAPVREVVPPVKIITKNRSDMK